MWRIERSQVEAGANASVHRPNEPEVAAGRREKHSPGANDVAIVRFANFEL
jgi:hypothetical protein